MKGICVRKLVKNNNNKTQQQQQQHRVMIYMNVIYTISFNSFIFKFILYLIFFFHFNSSTEFVAVVAIMCTLFLFLHTKNLTSRLREMEDRLQPSALNSGNDLNDYPAHQGKIINYVNLNT